MESFVGVPIRLDHRTIGVIALILPKDRGKALFKKISSTVTFMHSMADLIASKITDSQYSRIIEEKNDELKGILDANDTALIYTDFYGNILFANESFRKLFWITEPLLGKRIQELFPYESVQETFRAQERKSRMMKAAIEWNHFTASSTSSQSMSRNMASPCCLPSANTARSRRNPCSLRTEAILPSISWRISAIWSC